MTNQKGYNYALRLISRKDYSEKELKLKLCSKFPLDTAEVSDIFAKLKEYGYVDDNRVSKNFINYKSTAGYGKRRIKDGLYLKGLTEHLSEVDDYFIDNKEEIKAVILEKLTARYKILLSKNDPKIREKLLGFLIRRGYAYDESKEILKEVIKSESDLS